jgi:hypothetical protein
MSNVTVLLCWNLSLKVKIMVKHMLEHRPALKAVISGKIGIRKEGE